MTLRIYAPQRDEIGAADGGTSLSITPTKPAPGLAAADFSVFHHTPTARGESLEEKSRDWQSKMGAMPMPS